MVIKVGDKWRIESDEHCWMVQRYMGRRKNRQSGEPEENWEQVTYHAELEGAALSLMQLRVRQIKGDDVEMVVKEIRKIREEVLGVLAPFRELSCKRCAGVAEADEVMN